jgi:cytoskeletal protein RodZ
MAKREPEPEPPQEELVEPELAPVGERLRLAREEKKLSLEDLAAQTRIPQRHLASIETGEWDSLPAPTYTIGFAKSYASAVGLDRTEIGNQLREEMGGQRFANTLADVFEPADPARTMPKGLVIGAIAAVIVLIAVMSWLNNRSLNQTNEPQAEIASPPPVATQGSAPPAATPAAAQEPVVLTAIAPVWLQVSDKGASLFSGMLQPGQTYAVPPTAAAPVLKTGKSEALRITVGNAVAGPVGPPATTVSNVSLLPADLLKAPAGTAPAGTAPAAAAPRAAAAPSATPPPRPRARPRRPVEATAPPAAPETAPTNNTAQ